MAFGRIGVGVGVVAVSVLAWSSGGRAAERAEGVPTFAKDVAPILYSKCIECHRPTMFAPMSLVKYDDARPWAKSIKQRVTARHDAAVGRRSRARHVQERSALVGQGNRDHLGLGRWWRAEGQRHGHAEGSAFVDGWTIGQPDVVFEMDEEFKIPATGTIRYQYLRVPTNLTEDKWIQAIEIKPGARAHVHHVLAYTQPAGSPLNENGALGPTNIGGVTPNKPGLVFAPGVARLLTRATPTSCCRCTTRPTARKRRTSTISRRHLREGAADEARGRRHGA